MNTHLLVAAAVALAAPVQAQAADGDRTGHRAIAARDLPDAERRLVAERRVFPRRPELMLNLAAVYGGTGRAAQARALYADVLAAPPVAMDLASGAVASSHEVATRGMALLERPTTAIAAR